MAKDTLPAPEVPEGNEVFRCACAADLSGLVGLFLELTDDMDVRIPCERDVQQIIAASIETGGRFSPRGEGRLVLVAESQETEESRVIGMCTLVFSSNCWVGALVCEIRDLVVSRPERGRGLGARLLEAAFREARARGAVLASLFTESSHGEACSFYRSLGFQEKSCTYFEMRL
jgi:GNAT superfamily N-acetyltransferase